jgi:hypothetical protein
VKLGLIFSLIAIMAEAAATNPYAFISQRNVFHLNPLPPPPPAEVPKPDLPVIKLSGFCKVGTVTRALFSSVPKDKKERPTYYSLCEGQGQGILKVLKINAAAGAVQILNSGEAATLTLKDDTLKPGSEPPTQMARTGQHGRLPFYQPQVRRNLTFGLPGRPSQR